MDGRVISIRWAPVYKYQNMTEQAYALFSREERNTIHLYQSYFKNYAHSSAAVPNIIERFVQAVSFDLLFCEKASNRLNRPLD